MNRSCDITFLISPSWRHDFGVTKLMWIFFLSVAPPKPNSRPWIHMKNPSPLPAGRFHCSKTSTQRNALLEEIHPASSCFSCLHRYDVQYSGGELCESEALPLLSVVGAQVGRQSGVHLGRTNHALSWRHRTPSWSLKPLRFFLQLLLRILCIKMLFRLTGSWDGAVQFTVRSCS